MARQRPGRPAMSRRCFVGGSAIGSALLIGTGLAGCATVSMEGAGTGGPSHAPAPRYRLALVDAPDLGTVGGVRHVVYGSFDFYLIRKSEDELIALANVCSHQRCAIDYVETARALACPCHGSRFDLNGIPMQGPARAALSRYNVTLVDGVVEVAFSA